MAMSTSTHKDTGNKKSTKNGLVLIWLDDNAGEDPNVKDIFLSLFEHVFLFTDTGECLELVESVENETPCISILVSGKYGQMLVHDRFQPLKQVKDIYVYCFDIVKHSQWAQQCDKVRCVDSDFGKILKCVQHDIQKTTKQKHEQPIEDKQEEEQEQEQEESILQVPERFMDSNNLYDQLALDLLLQNSDEDGEEDFTKYCQTYKENNKDQEVDKQQQQQEQDFKVNSPIKEWFKRDLFFVNLNSTNLTQLWTLRWFIKLFYRQLFNEYEHIIKDEKNFTIYYGTWLNTDELDGMKHRIGQMIIFAELLTAYANKKKAFSSIENSTDQQTKYKVVFEININTKTSLTIPYGEIEKDEFLIWFGSRYRIMKIEFIEEEKEESYWLIGLNLCSTLDTNESIQTLYKYYYNILKELNDIHYAFGRILIYKGLYNQAEKWLQINNHYEDLAELAIRQYQCERANQYLQNLSEDSNDANLLRAYINLLLSSDTIPKGRTILMKICSDATDKIIRARANIALGFINLIVTQQFDQALEYFTLGNETLCKYLPDIHPDIAKSYIGIGYTHFILHNIDKAENCFQTAFNIQKQSLPYKHPDLAKIRNGLAHCLSVKKQTIKQALKEFEYAYQILIETFPQEYKTHPEILLTINDIERLKKGKELRARNTLLDYI